MMSRELEVIINMAIRKANELKHEYLTLESILYSLLTDQTVVETLEKCHGDVTTLKTELESFLSEDDNFSILTEDQIDELSKKQFANEEIRKIANESGIKYQPEISMALQRVIQRAAVHVQSSGQKHIKAINLLVAMFHEKDSFALYSLEKQNVKRFDVIQYISHGLQKSGESQTHTEHTSTIEGEAETKSDSGSKYLSQYAVCLNDLVHKDQIDPLVGREKEVNRIIEVLCRRRKNNPILVGDAGVGKTAIAEGLAFKIENHDVPEVLLDTEVYSLDMASLMAGAKFRGDFEQRLKGVIEDVEKMGEQGNKPILFIDELHTVMGAGATSGSSMDASNLLKPYLSSGKIRVLGSTTHEEYRKLIEKDSAFNRRFQKIDVLEPNLDDTYKILLGLKEKFEKHHHVKYGPSILKLAVDLGDRYITDRKNPDKSIDIIDEAGASLHLLPLKNRRNQISKKDIENVVAKLAGVPKITVSATEKEKLEKLNENLKMVVYGQDHAIDQITDAVLMSRSGLVGQDRTMGSFLFAGPTGVGKTELARQLAIFLDSELQRFDMSEYMEKHAVSKLIGAPPGYVGFDQGGSLTDAIKKSPYSVLLLDEIEKAHPDILNILLQVMDHGKLTDAQGRITDFRHVVIIMTTNAGAGLLDANTIGLANNGSKISTSKRDQAIKNAFTPEFRNRLDAIINFNSLSDDQFLQIVNKFIMQIEAQLAKKNIELNVDEKVLKWLSDNGRDPKMGARPIARIVDEKIKKPLSKEILFGKLSKGGLANLNLAKNNQNEDEITFEIKEKK
jgi:ATP-dependent Clp protease ATP-binding subunit ClpA